MNPPDPIDGLEIWRLCAYAAAFLLLGLVVIASVVL